MSGSERVVKPSRAKCLILCSQVVENDIMLKAKRTVYREFHFRSQLEARWAVFFDAIGVKYKYEPFWADVDTNRGVIYYKPDFEITLSDGHVYYVEIKPTAPSGNALTKASGWARYIGSVVILFDLNPPKTTTESGWLFELGDRCNQVFMTPNIWWCECPLCRYLGLQPFGELPCKCYSQRDCSLSRQWEETFGEVTTLEFARTPKLLMAYQKAKNHKF